MVNQDITVPALEPDNCRYIGSVRVTVLLRFIQVYPNLPGQPGHIRLRCSVQMLPVKILGVRCNMSGIPVEYRLLQCGFNQKIIHKVPHPLMQIKQFRTQGGIVLKGCAQIGRMG